MVKQCSDQSYTPNNVLFHSVAPLIKRGLTFSHQGVRDFGLGRLADELLTLTLLEGALNEEAQTPERRSYAKVVLVACWLARLFPSCFSCY